MNKKRLSRKSFSWPKRQGFYFVFGVLLLALISIPVYDRFKKQRVLSGEVGNLQSEVKKMEDRNQELEKMITYLESDEFIEVEARNKLNYKKEGEEMVIIKNSQELSDNDELGGLVNIKKSNLAKKWYRYFIH
jgi:cell division protein FtsB